MIEIKPDLHKLIDLAARRENFDAPLAAARGAGKPIEPEQSTTMSASASSNELLTCATSGQFNSSKTGHLHVNVDSKPDGRIAPSYSRWRAFSRLHFSSSHVRYSAQARGGGPERVAGQ